MYRVATILLLGAAAVWTASALRAAPAAGENQSVESLKTEKLKAAEEWWQAFVARDQAAASPVAPDEEFKAAKALKDAEIDVAQNKQQRIRALESYRDRMNAVYKKTSVRSQAAQQGGEAERVAEARIHLLEAKIRLKEEDAK